MRMIYANADDLKVIARKVNILNKYNRLEKQQQQFEVNNNNNEIAKTEITESEILKVNSEILLENIELNNETEIVQTATETTIETTATRSNFLFHYYFSCNKKFTDDNTLMKNKNDELVIQQQKLNQQQIQQQQQQQLEQTQKHKKGKQAKNDKNNQAKMPLTARATSSVAISQSRFSLNSPTPSQKQHTKREYTSLQDFQRSRDRERLSWKDKSQRFQTVQLAPDILYINTYLEKCDSKFLSEPLLRTNSLEVSASARKRLNAIKTGTRVFTGRKLFQRIANMDIKSEAAQAAATHTASMNSSADAKLRKPFVGITFQEYEILKQTRRPLKFENPHFYDKPYSGRLRSSHHHGHGVQSPATPSYDYYPLNFDSDTFNSIIETHGKNRNTVQSYMKYFKSKLMSTSNDTTINEAGATTAEPTVVNA